MSKTEMTRRNFVAAGSAMALALVASTALAEQAPAPAEGEGAPEGGEGGGEGGPGAGGPGAGGPGPMGAPKDVPAAREAAAAEGRTFGYAGAGDWLGVPDDVEVAEEINDFDAVVIGGGHAGTQATLALAEAGAKVAMCEKSTYLMYIGEDAAAWNADFVKNAGFSEYNLGEVINEFTTRSGGRVSQEIVASYVNNSGECLDNMLACMKEAVEDSERHDLYNQLVSDLALTNNEYSSEGGAYAQDIDESFYTYDVTRNGKIIIQAMFDADKVKELTADIDWASLAVDPNCETTEEGYQAGYQALYDACASFYDNNNQCLDHTGYPKAPGTKTWATTIQMMGHFHGREGHGGVAASSILGNVQMACLAKAYTLGAQVFLGYKGYKVVQAEDGTVTGVIVYDADADRYVKFNCKAVISCAGGYIQNADMCWALLNELQEKYERTGGLKEDFNGGGMACAGDGSGVKMLCWAGGFVDPSPRGHMSLGGGPSGTWGANCHLWLDENMQRFCNEGNITAAGDACSRKTGACYGIIGGDYLKHIASCGLEHTGPNFGRPEYIMDMMYDIETGEVNSQIKITGMTTAERMGGSIYKADSLENLAAGLGIEDVEGFVAAVNHYNDLCYACQDGTYTCDPEFGKNAEAMIPIEGPLYYGFSGSCGRSGSSPAMVTMSGVMANKNLNVEDLDGNPIPGLYCAGADLGGRYGTGYSTPAAGNSIGMALTNGRVAGKSAAAYLGL